MPNAFDTTTSNSSILNQVGTTSYVSMKDRSDVEIVEVPINTPEDNQYVTTFLGAWVNFTAGTTSFDRAAYRKTHDGYVELSGKIKTGVINTDAFTLPEGYRPSYTMLFPVVSNGAFGRVSVSAAGLVRPESGSNVYVQLDPIRFPAKDQSPRPSSAFPISIRTKFTRPPVGVFVLDCWRENDAEQNFGNLTPGIEWEFRKAEHGNVIVIKNIAPLAQMRRHTIRLMVIGG